MTWQLVFARQTLEDAKKLAASGLKPRSQALLAVLERDSFQNPPPFEKSVGDLAGTYSRRITWIRRCLTHRALSAPDAGCVKTPRKV